MNDDSIKAEGGRIVEDLFEKLMREFDYRCTRYGIEHVILNPLDISRSKYNKLKINPTAKLAPDFFVASKNLETSHFVECKYRSLFIAKGLGADLLRQAQLWPHIVVVIVRGDARVKKLDRIKCGQLKTDSGTLKLRKNLQSDWVDWSEDAWDNLGAIQDWFPVLPSSGKILQDFGANLDSISPGLKKKEKSKLLEQWKKFSG